MNGDGDIILAFRRDELRAMLNDLDLDDDQIERLQAAIPHSSVPEALQTIAQNIISTDWPSPLITSQGG